MKYFLYVRKSSETDERQIQSIEDQINYWKGRMTLDMEVVEIFSEEHSAKEPWKRVIFNAMMDRIDKGEAKGILCWKLDRLTRNPVDSGRIQWLLQKNKLEKILTSDREYYQVDSGLLFSVETGMANQFIIDLSKNTKRWMNWKAERGGFWHLANQGYLNDMGEKTVIPDPERFWLVRKMWDLFLTWGYSVTKICDIANNEWGYRTKKRKKSGGIKIGVSMLYKVFQNPFYMGYIIHNQKFIKGIHVPMVTREEFERAQGLFKNNRRWVIQTERPSKQEFPFTGTIICHECGCMVTAEKKFKKLASGGYSEHTYYHCTHRRDTRDFTCSQRKNITQKNIEIQINDILSSIQIHPDFLDWAKDILKRKHEAETSQNETIYQNLNRTIEQEEEKKNRLLNILIDGMVSKEEFEKRKIDIENTILLLKSKRNDVEKKSKTWFDIAEQVFDFASTAKNSFESGDLETRRLIFRSLGSNWILSGEKLSMDIHSWFLPLQKNETIHSGELSRLEPYKKGISMRNTDASSDVIIEWQPETWKTHTLEKMFDRWVELFLVSRGLIAKSE